MDLNVSEEVDGQFICLFLIAWIYFNRQYIDLSFPMLPLL